MPSPFDPEGWFGNTNDSDLNYQSITEKNPSGESFVGEFEYVGPSFGAITLSNDVSLMPGDHCISSILAKPDSFEWIRCVIQKRPENTAVVTVDVNLSDGTVGNSTGLPFDISFIELSDGYKLVQIGIDAPYSSDFSTVHWMQGNDGSGTFNPMVGDKIKCQAAFFGKADDFPANVMPTL